MTTTTNASAHATFSIDRYLAAAPARVFRAFADPDAKARWFQGPKGTWSPEIREMDFRVGGTERVRGALAAGGSTDFRATYHDIVPDERIVYVYDMYHNERKLSVSLATIQLHADGAGTRMVLTEQGVFFHGLDDAANREQGTKLLVDAIAKSVEGIRD
jgi:uncharacterized protein YndB with AHSA1/START domain